MQNGFSRRIGDSALCERHARPCPLRFPLAPESLDQRVVVTAGELHPEVWRHIRRRLMDVVVGRKAGAVQGAGSSIAGLGLAGRRTEGDLVMEREVGAKHALDLGRVGWELTLVGHMRKEAVRGLGRA
jgi:hypothetical protein